MTENQNRENAEQHDPDADRRAIEAIIDRQFRSLEWTDGAGGDWGAFSNDFREGASLYPAARPAAQQTVDAFVERMKGLAETTLTSFKERMLGTDIQVFGNVAVAMAGCKITEPGGKVSRGVEALLLIKDEGVWQIVSQAWDNESPARPLPAHLAADTGQG